jgi:uncharacterized protein (DUF58 family)
MNHELLRVLAQYLLYLFLILVPALVVLFSDRFRRQPSPSEYSVLFVAGIVIGVLAFLPAISIVAGTALAALLIARFVGEHSLDAVDLERKIHPARLFPGEEAELTITLSNRKLLPLAWVTVTDPLRFGLLRPGSTIEDQIHFSTGLEVLESLGHALVTRTAMAPFQSLRRTYRLTARRRGVYTFGPAEVESGDPFGIYTRQATLGRRQEIVVYPRVYRQEDIGLPFREALGEVIARRALVEDPLLMAGSREYRPGDPMQRMHWKATARTQELQVRVADPSTTVQVMIVLNLNTFQHLWQGIDLDRMDAAMDVAASLAVWALERDFAVGVHSNGVIAGGEGTPRIAPSANPRQAALLLEHMARLSFSGRFSPERVLVDEARRLPAGGSIIFVTPLITPEIVAVLTGRRLARRVSVVYCGRHAAPVVRGLPIHLARPAEEPLRAVS